MARWNPCLFLSVPVMARLGGTLFDSLSGLSSALVLFPGCLARSVIVPVFFLGVPRSAQNLGVLISPCWISDLTIVIFFSPPPLFFYIRLGSCATLLASDFLLLWIVTALALSSLSSSSSWMTVFLAPFAFCVTCLPRLSLLLFFFFIWPFSLLPSVPSV